MPEPSSSSGFKNFYAVLGIANFADDDAIKTAFRTLARQYHPDVTGGDAVLEERFKQINEAYSTLSDSARRPQYDQALRIWLMGKAGAAPKSTPGNKPPPVSEGKATASGASKQPPPKPKAPPKPPPPKPDADAKASSTPINDLFDSFLKGKPFGGKPAHESFTKPSGAKASAKPSTGPIFGSNPKPQRGEDITVDAQITPQEAQDGVVKTVNVEHSELCRRCSGTGRLNGQMCSECQGEKTQSRTRRIDVRIPAGVKAGSKVRVTKEGGRGYDGGEPGDLYLVIQIESEPASASTASSGQKSDLDTRADVSLTVTQAVLGCSLEVQTPQGPISMIIPPLTPSGKVFRLRNQGSRSGDLKGDHYVTVGITMPSTITPKERELYQELHHLAIERDTSQYTDS